MRSSAVLPGHQRGHGDRAGIDHGVERPVGDLVEHDGIKGLAGGLDADMTQHIVAPVMLKRVAVELGDIVGDLTGVDA
ncbi:MAG: hypothetical protein WBQ20_08165 [Methyloceanibacter sp.]